MALRRQYVRRPTRCGSRSKAGRSVYVLACNRPQRHRWVGKDEFLARGQRAQADPGLREDLAILAGETIDDLR
ncbi:hypothetical protein [Mycobacterium sp. URHB0044]|uniref:hypothetical protein n=1 Tax=Mycobacterium sp. URHB0044 TaxID=1380386 RepID=UPI0009DEB058